MQTQMPLEETPATVSALAKPECIVVATDLTDTEFLVPHAIAQAKQTGARVVLVHAFPASYPVPCDPASIPHMDGSKIPRDSRLLLLGIAQQIESAGLACNVICQAGDPFGTLEEAVVEVNATRVIMGTHGYGKLGQFALGSVAHEAIEKLDVPVFAVGTHAHHPAHGTPQRILHPVSLNGAYRETVQLAVELARAWKAELTLFYVFDGDIQVQADPERRADWARTALADLIPDDLHLAVPVHTAAAFGKIPESIVRAAAQRETDWIVMGVNAQARHWTFKEDAAYQVIAAAPCPVLTLRHGANPLSAPEPAASANFSTACLSPVVP